jgi:chemotaxis protein methyltransferase CheR
MMDIMNKKEQSPSDYDVMSDRLFFRFSTFIQNETGIKMPEAKKMMLQARLLKECANWG